MTRAGQIVIVTMGLIGAGLVCGALAGAAAVALVSLLAGEGVDSEVLGMGAFVGAPLGAITAPLVSWLLLRRVSFGRMFLVCSVGTAIGGVVGWFALASGDVALNALGSAFVGCVIAAIALHHRVRHA